PSDGHHLWHLLHAEGLSGLPEGNRDGVAAHALHRADPQRDAPQRAVLVGRGLDRGRPGLGCARRDRRPAALPLAAEGILMPEPKIAFFVSRPDSPALEVRVNFGVFAGRQVTPAEIDELGRFLLDEVGAVTIVAEDRYELDPSLETSVHMVRIELT